MDKVAPDTRMLRDFLLFLRGRNIHFCNKVDVVHRHSLVADTTVPGYFPVKDSDDRLVAEFFGKKIEGGK